MLTLVITQKRIFASASQQLLHTINTSSPLSSNPSDHGSLAEILEAQLPLLKAQYLDHVKQHFSEPPLTIPVSISIPMDPVGAVEGEKILDLFRNPAQSDFSLIFTDNLAKSFLYGISPQNGLVSGACIVLEALEDTVNLYYHNLKDKDIPFPVLPLNNLGNLPGRTRLFDKVVNQVRQGGIELVKTEQQNFRNWLNTEFSGEGITYAFAHQLEGTEIQFQVQVPTSAVRKAMAYGKEDLQKYLNPEQLSAQNIYKVVLLGEFFQNPLLIDYMSHELGIGDKLQSGPPLETDIETLVKGLDYRANHFLREKIRRAKALKRKKEAIERKNKVKEAKQLTQELNLEIQQFENREKFFARVENLQITPEEEDQYVAQLVQEGKALNLPEAVIQFNVEKVLAKGRIQVLKNQSQALEEELKRLEEFDSSGEPDNLDSDETEISYEEVLDFIEPIVPLEETDPFWDEEENTEEENDAESDHPNNDLPPSPQPAEIGQPASLTSVIAKPTAPALAVPTLTRPAGDVWVPTLDPPQEVKTIAKKADFSPQVQVVDKEGEAKRIRDLFQVKQFLQTPDFQTMVVNASYSKKAMILRLITFQQLEDPMMWESFVAIHRKEASYYTDVSEIRTAKEGLYYIRKAMEGVPLRVYMRKCGLDRKVNVEKFSTQDNLLILEVIRAIMELEVAHPNLNEDNVLIQVKRSWNLEKSIRVNLSGFTPEPGLVDENIELMNYMFERLLRPIVYNEFRKKHCI